MSKPKLTLQPSEAILAQAAAQIYAAYISSGRVTEGHEKDWMDRSLREAYRLIRLADEAVQSDDELPTK